MPISAELPVEKHEHLDEVSLADGNAAASGGGAGATQTAGETFLGDWPSTSLVRCLKLKGPCSIQSTALLLDTGAYDYYEQPLVSPQLMHFRQVPLRTSVNCLQF